MKHVSRRELRPEDYHGCAGVMVGFGIALICVIVCAVVYFLIFA